MKFFGLFAALLISFFLCIFVIPTNPDKTSASSKELSVKEQSKIFYDMESSFNKKILVVAKNNLATIKNQNFQRPSLGCLLKAASVSKMNKYDLVVAYIHNKMILSENKNIIDDYINNLEKTSFSNFDLQAAKLVSLKAALSVKDLIESSYNECAFSQYVIENYKDEFFPLNRKEDNSYYNKYYIKAIKLLNKNGISKSKTKIL